MKILDMCCGSKMFWYEKYEPHTTYMDIRKDTYTTMDRGKERKIEIAPDIQADFTDMPDADNIGKIVMDGMNPKRKLNKQLKKMVEVMQGVYKDDRQVTKLLVVKRYADRPRVEVRIKRDMGD